LARLLRADLLPEAWIAPPPVRQLRALLRHRVALVRLRTLLRNRIHAIVAGYGHDRPAGAYWSGPGRAWLASLDLPVVSRELAGDDLGLIGALQERTGRLDQEVRQRARSDPRVKVLT
jgi:transposase